MEGEYLNKEHLMVALAIAVKQLKEQEEELLGSDYCSALRQCLEETLEFLKKDGDVTIIG